MDPCTVVTKGKSIKKGYRFHMWSRSWQTMLHYSERPRAVEVETRQARANAIGAKSE